MNKMTRMLAMTAMTVAAGLTTVAAPASAAPAVEPAPKASATAPSAKHQTGVNQRERIAGFYRSPFACHKVGRIGEWQRRWSDYDCDRVFWGPRRGWYALKVTTWGGPHWNNNGGGQHWNNSGGGQHWNDNDGGPHWNKGKDVHPGR